MAKYNTRRANKKTPRTVSVPKETSSNVTGPADEISNSIETNKKRKALKAPGEFQKDIKRSKKTDSNHDNYCWKCHSKDAEINCSTCSRAFHFDCLKASKINKEGSCYVCLQQSTAFSIDDEVQLSELLKHIINTACPLNKKEYLPIINWPDSEENEKLFCIKDFSFIYDKCIQRGILYESPRELVDDVEWILHNCIILYGDKSSIVKNTKKVLKCINNELNDAVDCPECYFKKIGNEPSSLTILHICKTPHPLVWAKVRGYSYWPAKCLKVSNEKARVRFFGTHQIGNVSLSDVVSMSENYSSRYSKANLIMAMEELKAYIRLFYADFQSLPYKNTSGEDFDLDQYLKQHIHLGSSAKKNNNQSTTEGKDKKVNSPFNFEEEVNFLKDIMDKISRRRIIPEDSFQVSSVTKSDSHPAVVDLTDDASEDDEDQFSDHTPPVHETANLLEEALVPPSDDADNNLDNMLENDVMLKAGLEDAKALFIEEECPIAISNVISGPDVPSVSSTDLFDAHRNIEPTIQNNFGMSIKSTVPDLFQSTSVFPQNNFSSSNVMQLSLRNFERTSERTSFNTYANEDRDIEIIDLEVSSSDRLRRNRIDKQCILQAILNRDENASSLLKLTNALVQDLYIHWWGNGSKVQKPEKIIQAQEYEIAALKAQLDEVTKEVSLMKGRYESLQKENQEKTALIIEYEERIQNADKFVKSFRNEAEKLKKETEKLKKELERKSQMIDENIHVEKLKEAKTIKYCNYCLEKQAIILCCYNGVKSFAYCSRECKVKDVLHKCESSSSSKPEKGEDPTPGPVAIERGVVQQSTTLFITSTVETRSVQSHISNKEKTNLSAPQQSSSANVKINKVVSSAKKTLEVARNINRNRNSPDIY